MSDINASGKPTVCVLHTRCVTKEKAGNIRVVVSVCVTDVKVLKQQTAHGGESFSGNRPNGNHPSVCMKQDNSAILRS